MAKIVRVLIAIFILAAVSIALSANTQDKGPALGVSALTLLGVPLIGYPAFDNRKRVGIKEACTIIKEIMRPLKKGISADILNNLQPGQSKTFSALKAEMNVPQTTLYNNLRTLEELGYVLKTDEWPAKYYASPEVEYVRLVATEIQERKLERIKSHLESAPVPVEV